MKKSKLFHGKGLFRFLRDKLMKPVADDNQESGATGRRPDVKGVPHRLHDSPPRPRYDNNDTPPRPRHDKQKLEPFHPDDGVRIDEKSKTITENIMALVRASPSQSLHTKISEESYILDKSPTESSGFSHTYTLHTPHDVHTSSLDSPRGFPQTYTLKTTSDAKSTIGLETEADDRLTMDDKPLFEHIVKKINKSPIVRVLANNPNSPYAINVTKRSRTIFTSPKNEKLSKRSKISKQKKDGRKRISLQNESKFGRVTDLTSGYKKSKEMLNEYGEPKQRDLKAFAGKKDHTMVGKEMHGIADQLFSVDSYDDEFSWDLGPHNVNSSLYKTPADTDNTIAIDTVSEFTYTGTEKNFFNHLEISAEEKSTIMEDIIDIGPEEHGDRATKRTDKYSSDSALKNAKPSQIQNLEMRISKEDTDTKDNESFRAETLEVDDDDSSTLKFDNQTTKSQSRELLSSINFSTESNTLVDTIGSREFRDIMWQKEKRLSTDTLLDMANRVLHSRISHMDNPHQFHADRLKEMFKQALWKDNLQHRKIIGSMDTTTGQTKSDTHTRLKSSSESDTSEMPSNVSHVTQSSRWGDSDHYGKKNHTSTKRTREYPQAQTRKHYPTIAKRTMHLDNIKKRTNSEENTEVTTNSIWNSKSSMQKNATSKSQSYGDLQKEDLYKHVIDELFQDFTKKFSEKLQSVVPSNDELSGQLNLSKHDDEDGDSSISSQSGESEYSGTSEGSTGELHVQRISHIHKEIDRYVTNEDSNSRKFSKTTVVPDSKTTVVPDRKTTVSPDRKTTVVPDRKTTVVPENDSEDVSTESSESEVMKAGDQNKSVTHSHSVYKGSSIDNATSDGSEAHKEDLGSRNYRVFEKKSFKLTPIRVNIIDNDAGKTDSGDENDTAQEYSDHRKSHSSRQKIHVRKGNNRTQAKHRLSRTPERHKETTKAHNLPSTSFALHSEEESDTCETTDRDVRSPTYPHSKGVTGEDVKPHNIRNISGAHRVDSKENPTPRSKNSTEVKPMPRSKIPTDVKNTPCSASSPGVSKRGQYSEPSPAVKSGKVGDIRYSKESAYSKIKPRNLKQECENSIEAAFHQRSMAVREKSERIDESIQKSLEKISLSMRGTSKRSSLERPDPERPGLFSDETNTAKMLQLPVRPLGGCRGRQCKMSSPVFKR